MTFNDARLLVPGRTCWRIERANRLAVIVDAALYFRLVKAAMLKAKHRIMLIGWDFDTRIKFEPDRQTLEGPGRLGQFLSWLPKHRPGLQVYVLKWDLGAIQALGRGMTPLFVLNWVTSSRLHFKLDGAHPVGSAHHQKVAVVDDALAFCGGIDMTADRWDTREHKDSDPCRIRPNGRTYGPWHDATTAVDGGAARALGDLARERWQQATGEPLGPIPGPSDPWPEALRPTAERVDVAIARTLPEFDGRKGVCEVEALYLEAIARAERTIYIETQYLAARRVAEALARRLHELGGPEIVIVMPEGIEGWLEHKTMDGARVKLLDLLWRADRYKRLGVYYPVTTNSQSIFVHAKILVIDDKLLRVGSSNLNNRSMGFDSECDLAIEAVPGSPDYERLREVIVSVRCGLLCEHLGIDATALAAAMDEMSGSLLQTVRALSGTGRTLKSLDRTELAEDESVLAENELLDPERPAQRPMKRLISGTSRIFTKLPMRRIQ
jgi:phosphatidylserine/phosphatidylglycerophosphate/cardiolipin synthase-like enzyme